MSNLTNTQEQEPLVKKYQEPELESEPLWKRLGAGAAKILFGSQPCNSTYKLTPDDNKLIYTLKLLGQSFCNLANLSSVPAVRTLTNS